jgi:hypothetical protein
MILAHGERHSSARQQTLRARALETARVLAADPGILAVLLSGSTARGPVGPASDLDMHIVAAAAWTGRVPPWRFGDDGIIENIHVVPEGTLRAGLSSLGDAAHMAHWFHTTSLGDELHDSETLYLRDRDDTVLTRLPALLAQRRDPEIVAHLVTLHAQAALAAIARSASVARAGAARHAHHMLREAAQSLLVSTLVRVGWIVRGSKKRIEIADAYATDPLVKDVRDLVTDVVAVEHLTPAEARSLCERRLLLRQTAADALARFETTRTPTGAELDEIAAYRTHNSGATDYYQPLLDEGFFRGPINHIRALSGFSRVPALILRAADPDAVTSIDSFMECGLVPSALRQDWAAIAHLEPHRVPSWLSAMHGAALRILGAL